MGETRLTRKNSSYELLTYDPSWSKKFDDMKAGLASVYGTNLLKIEHIGSTSVVGMVAKPQIDILVVVNDLKQVKLLYDQMTALGYVVKGDYSNIDEEYFTLDRGGRRQFNVHTMQKDNPRISKYIIFRDYLRNHPSAREEYIAEKLRLQKTYGNQDYNAYDFGKEKPVEKLIKEALAWHSSLS